MIDTHQHLIFRDQFDYSWADNIPALATGSFTQNDYQQLSAGKGITGTIFMEAAADDPDYQDEARFVAKLVGTNGLLGQIASCRPETEASLDAWLEQHDALNIVGYRRILHEVSDDMSQGPTFRRNLRKIGQAGLPFDLCILARQLPIALELVRACDDQTFVLDHCGVPDIAGEAFDEWSIGLTAMAAQQNVYVKLSGISAYRTPGTATLETLRPWAERVIDLVGTKRIVWGSDWPVVNRGNSLPDWLDISDQILSQLLASERQDIAVTNAQVVYSVWSAG